MEKTENGEEEFKQQLWSWGAGTEGQLGTGRIEDDHLPQLLHLPSIFSSDESISMLACGGAHVIAMTSGGRVLTWGRGTSGQLGHGEMVNCLHPKPVMCLESYFIIHVAAGWNHSGFVSDTGCGFTCGDGSFGQLGHGDFRSHCSPVNVSYFVSKHVEQVACGMRHSLVLLKGHAGHEVYGFGSGKRGQLGISADRLGSVSIPQITLGFEDIKNLEISSIAANGDHSAALCANGNVYTWGKGFSGSKDAVCPQCLSSPLRFTGVALGWNHALLLDGDGQVYMLGGKHHGVLSNPKKKKLTTHISDSGVDILDRIPGETNVLHIAAGSEHSVLVTANGAIKTWGWGEHGQLGLGSTSDEETPQQVYLNNQSPSEHSNIKIYCGSGFTFVIKTSCSNLNR